MSGFYELFAPYAGRLAKYDRALKDAEIIKATANSSEGTLGVTVGFKLLMSEETLHKIGEILAEELKIERVEINPVFPSGLLSNKYDGEIVKLIKKEIVVANGFLDGCDFSYNDGTLTIILTRGGKDIFF